MIDKWTHDIAWLAWAHDDGSILWLLAAAFGVWLMYCIATLPVNYCKRWSFTHGIPRAEWEARFRRRCIERAHLTALEADHVTAFELNCWPVWATDWQDTTPEDAADECMSYWTDDEGDVK